MKRGTKVRSGDALADWVRSVSRQRIHQYKKDLKFRGLEQDLSNLESCLKSLRKAPLRKNPCYQLWLSLLNRCENNIIYKDCSVSDEFKDFEYFSNWCNNQAGFLDRDDSGNIFELDKDLLSQTKKEYHPDICVFVPQEVNTFILNMAGTKDLPVGVCYHKENDRYIVQCRGVGKLYQGSFDSIEDARSKYEAVKVSKARQLAEKWVGRIDNRVYEKLHNFKLYLQS